MNRIVAAVSFALCAATALPAAAPAQSPDFWYVVPEGVSTSKVSASVRGIVVPSVVNPTVRTTPEGSVISWRRPDGKRQSFAVRGVPSVTFEPGPIKGTTYVPFSRARVLDVVWPDKSCCSCATFLDSVDSIEMLACVPGCAGCSCEACICDPTYPCPASPSATMQLIAHNGAAPVMTFKDPADRNRVGIAFGEGRAVKFLGKNLSAELTESGETVIHDADAIEIAGRVVTSTAQRGERALFSWVAADASVILEQPSSMPQPMWRNGAVELAATSKRLAIDPVSSRCNVCATYPNSVADVNIYQCVPGDSTCYRCVNFACQTPQL